MKKKFLISLLTLGLIFSACGKKEENKTENLASESQNPVSRSEKSTGETEPEQEEEKKVVYTSFFPIYNLAKQIAGDKVEVRSLTSLESEAHDFEPSAKDLAALNESGLFLANGAGMEEYLDDIGEASKIKIVDTSAKVEKIKADEDDHDHDEGEEDHDHDDEADDYEGHEEDKEDHDHDEDDNHEDHEEGHHHHGAYDPHTRLSPKNGIKQAEEIYLALSNLDPDNTDYYKENYLKIQEELKEIISDYEGKFKEVGTNKLLVSHEAFGYLCRDFGLDQVSLTGLTSTGEADAKTMKEVTDFAKKNQVKIIFYEKAGSDKNAKTIAEEIGGEAVGLNTLEMATKEDLEKETSYQDLIKENLEIIYQALR